ncbi:MAG TPA: malate dehydrogenase [Candidatus Omnitrophota bacterium]|nr:malate dehydrogenase [Candidatus Omnitrophota bacterium]
MKKVTIIGAGFVGGTAAMRIAESGLANVVLLDVVENVAKAKACDLEDARSALGRDTRIEGSSDMSLMEGSSVVVVTAGLPRKPGMTREDLLAKNGAIMESVCKSIVDYAKEAIVVIVSNPLDVMTFLAYKKTKIPRNKIFGMGVSLDTSRFANLIAKKLFAGIESIEALVIGSHGETMLPMPRLTRVRSKPLIDILMQAEVESLVKKTKERGAEIVSLYGSGSAYYAPSAAIYEIVDTIVSNHHKIIPVSAVLEGEYGLQDVSIGVPARIGSDGIEQIIEIDLFPEEKEAFFNSAQAIKDSIKILNP